MLRIQFHSTDEWYCAMISLDLDLKGDLRILIPFEETEEKERQWAEKVIEQIQKLIEDGTIDISVPKKLRKTKTKKDLK